jgi:amino acid permease
MRWLAFITMISLALNKSFSEDALEDPPIVDIKGVPNFFGVCIYAFMCHHSLPSIY